MSGWLWAAYFAVKLLLHGAGKIHMHFWPNVLLLGATMPFIPEAKTGPRPMSRPRLIACLLAAAGIAWYDSYFPSIAYVVGYVKENPEVLSPLFLLQLLGGYVNPAMLAGSAALICICWGAAKFRLHPTPLVFLALLILPIQAVREPRAALDAKLQRFYDREAGRRIRLPKATGRPFDVVYIHVCSLSWDDLAAAQVAKPRLLAGANYIWTGFSSATSYSTPAGLRLLRATCGQAPHAALYDPWPKDCGLLDSLRSAGYSTFAAFNHSGDAYDMRQTLRKLAGMDALVDTAGLRTRLINFDKEPILDDGEVLDRLWSRRQASGAARAALYYNTITLHGGAHQDVSGWWRNPTEPLYRENLDRLGVELDAFYARIQASGRSAVVFIIPEHGRALRGASVQAKELRDIPLPRIANVPAAVRFVGKAFRGASTGPASLKSVSYSAFAQLLSDVISDPTLPGDPRRLDAAVAALPMTELVAETDQWKIMADDRPDRFRAYGKDRSWREMPRDVNLLTDAEISAVRGIAR